MGLGLAFRCFMAALRSGDEATRMKRAIDGIKDPPVIKEVIREVMVPQRGAPPPREIIKEVPVEVIKEVPVEVVREVIKEIPVEVIKEVIKEVPVEVIREVQVPVEVIKEVYRDAPPARAPHEIVKETIREVPVETVREVIKRIPDTLGPVHLLALLQQEGRFVDFLCENIDGYEDDKIGAAAREIHAKCRKALFKFVTLEPVRPEREGEVVTLDADYDPSTIQLSGQTNTTLGMFGTLKHRGWRATKVELPPRPSGADLTIVMPAEVELESEQVRKSRKPAKKG